MKKNSHNHDVDRRAFLRAAGVLAATSLGNGRISAAFSEAHSKPSEPKRIADLELDLNSIHKWDDSNGDTWDPFWADDDHLYSFNDDGRGFGKVGENLAFNRFAKQIKNEICAPVKILERTSLPYSSVPRR